MNILAFSFFPTMVPPTSGGEKRLYELYSALSHYHSVTLISSSWLDRPSATVRHGANFREFRVRKPDELGHIYGSLSALSDADADISGPAVYKAGFVPNEMHQVYFDHYENIDVIIHDSPFTISYDVMAGIDSIPRIYNSYNCETQLYSEMHQSDSAEPIRDLVKEAERRLLSCIDLLTCCSLEDADLLTSHAKREVSWTLVPNGASDRSRPRRPDSSFPRALFIGSRHQPNQEAAAFIAHKLAFELPEVTFDITGHCLAEGVYPSNVRRHGFVSEELKNELLSTCDVALNPMITGGGSNLKVTEYLSYGIPILSTRFGVRGVGLTPLVDYIEGERSEFPTLIREILRDRDCLERIGSSGRRRFLNTLSWPSIAKDFSCKISSLVRQNRPSREKHVVGLNDYDFTTMQSGGATRIRGLYDHMKSERDILYMVMTDDGEWSVDRWIDGMTIVRVPKTNDHIDEQKRVDSLYHLSAADIVSLYMIPRNKFFLACFKALKKGAICVITDHIYTSGVVSDSDVWVYSSQNHETSLKSEMLAGHPLFHFLIEKVRRAEERAMSRAVSVICVSDGDAAKMIKGRRSAVPVIVVPNGVLPPSKHELDESKVFEPQVAARSCLFIGSGHPPNVDACRFIVEDLAPLLDDVEFHLIGGACDQFEGRVPTNVRLWGRLEEAEKIAVARAVRLALNPIDTGGGSNVKIADYFSLGLPVLSTPFGVRGFPSEVVAAVDVRKRSQFADGIEYHLQTFEEHDKYSARLSLFDRYLNASSLGAKLADVVSVIGVSRKKVLFVTYRLTFPPRGGAEAHLLKLISHLSRSNRYDIDVVAPDLDTIGDSGRFLGTYAADPERTGPFDFPNLHWARFDLDAMPAAAVGHNLGKLWEAQAAFDQVMKQGSLKKVDEPCLLWGWGAIESQGGSDVRWAFLDSAILAPKGGALRVTGSAAVPVILSSALDSSTNISPVRLEGPFAIDIQISPGVCSFRISTSFDAGLDPRPLGILVDQISIDGVSIIGRDLDVSSIETPDKVIDRLGAAAAETRQGCSLSDVRGPYSLSLEGWIENNIEEYDLLITHNNVFRPVVRSLEIAKTRGIPAILIPHAHLDDDYYHFPDMITSIESASLVLAAPSSAVSYIKRYNPNTRYHGPGVDIGDVTTVADIELFRAAYGSREPFLLVLGRKAAAKNYRWVIGSAREAGIQVVMIGPDDDGLPILDSHVFYMGKQPRSIVRGALASCLFLVNMSSSESFGMVLLEAWMAKRAVIVNRQCAAFLDLVRHGVNGLLASREDLASSMRTLMVDGDLRKLLGSTGHANARSYDWEWIGTEFDQMCRDVIAQGRRREVA